MKVPAARQRKSWRSGGGSSETFVYCRSLDSTWQFFSDIQPRLDHRKRSDSHRIRACVGITILPHARLLCITWSHKKKNGSSLTPLMRIRSFVAPPDLSVRSKIRSPHHNRCSFACTCHDCHQPKPRDPHAVIPLLIHTQSRRNSGGIYSQALTQVLSNHSAL